jgi:hypothetical protein
MGSFAFIEAIFNLLIEYFLKKKEITLKKSN